MLGFLRENPVIAAIALVLLLIALAFPIGVVRRRHFRNRQPPAGGNEETLLVGANRQPPSPLNQETRLVGIGLDVSMVILGLIILAVVIGIAIQVLAG